MGFDVRVFGQGIKSKSSTITAEDRLNVYFEVPSEADRSPIAAYGTAGTEYFCMPSGFVTRAMYYMPSLLGALVLQGRKLFLISDAGKVKKIAELPNYTDIDGEGYFTDNGSQLLLITYNHGYIIDTKNNYQITDITDQLPEGGSDSCCFLDGYFIVNRRNTQQFFISNLYDGLVWNALDFASAESSPDNLKAVAANNGYLYLFGELTTEIWVNNGGALFPFDRIQGSTITYGLVSTDSLAVINTAFIGLMRDRYGMLAIGTIEGGQFHELSTPDLSYIINGYETVSAADAFVYALNGRYFYQITFKEHATWLYDFKSGAWSRIASWDMEWSRYRYGLAFNRRFIVSSADTGRLATLNADVYTEEGYPIAREIRFNHVFAPTQNYSIVSRFRAWMDTGNGLVKYGANSGGGIGGWIIGDNNGYMLLLTGEDFLDKSSQNNAVTVNDTVTLEGARGYLMTNGYLSTGQFVDYITADKYRFLATIVLDSLDMGGGEPFVGAALLTCNTFSFEIGATALYLNDFSGMTHIVSFGFQVGVEYNIKIEWAGTGLRGVIVWINDVVVFDEPVVTFPTNTTNPTINGTSVGGWRKLPTYNIKGTMKNVLWQAVINNDPPHYSQPQPTEIQQGYEPTLYLQISRDKGNTWGNYLPTTLGKRGEFYKRAEWRRLGQARDWAFKIRMTDPVKFCLTDVSLAIGEANQ